MDLVRDQVRILRIWNQTNSDSDEELQQHPSDSEDNIEQVLHVATDQSEEESVSSDEELTVVRHNRIFLLDSGDDCSQ